MEEGLIVKSVLSVDLHTYKEGVPALVLYSWNGTDYSAIAAFVPDDPSGLDRVAASTLVRAEVQPPHRWAATGDLHLWPSALADKCPF